MPHNILCHTMSCATRCPMACPAEPHTAINRNLLLQKKQVNFWHSVAEIAQAPPVTLPMGRCFAVGSTVVGQHPSLSAGTSSLKVGSGRSRTTTVLGENGQWRGEAGEVGLGPSHS